MTRFTVNNQAVEYRLDPETPLLWALRDASNLTGTKYGCGVGQCGACTVDIDGRAVRSCQVPIGSIEGSFVTTVEGLSRDRSHPVQLAWMAENVGQCGFCTPGMVMAAAALLKRVRDPSEEEIRASITNLCRCGVYPRIVEAVQRAGRIARGDERVAPVARPGTSPAEASRTVPALTPARDDKAF
ncbi:(2Fe-2S)-binding protein [Sphingomonas aracearum]|uniref:(2Fe-2S)-binding protein n=1 Tax=Sphingomonas aracearum TaxID=2283317 RepID=A0A369VSJ9_9SPHN|nr:(2Fe-2S)-binding protein [Sphingomonas aracearum]RDE05374.1 (2Fe-2S)-binding protein [Sphingomonas aracearum]